MSELITTLTVIFVTSSVLLFLLNRLSHPTILAYIASGFLLSTYLPRESMLNLTQIGLAFLVFIFGTKLDPERLHSVAKESHIATSTQVIIVGAVSASFGLILGLGKIEIIFFSLAASLSSSLVGLDMIENKIRINLIHGRLAESIHLLQDVIAISVLILIGETISGAEVLLNAIHGVLIILGALIFRKRLIDKVKSITEGSTELVMLSSLSILIGFIGISEYFNISIAVGSFAAGIAVAKFPINLEIQDTAGTIKDFFSALFFVSLGALVRIPSAEIVVMTLSLLFISSIVKPMTIILSLLHQGYNKRTAILTGLSIDQMSEFALIIAIQVYLTGFISSELFQSIILATTISMLTSSYTTKHEDLLYRILSILPLIENESSKFSHEETFENLENHVILVGYDTQGKRIVEKLKEEEKTFILIENDPEKVSDLKDRGEKYVFGDVVEKESWEKAGHKGADLIISTIPIESISERILEIDNDVRKILRARDKETASKLMDKGAFYVVVPDLVSSEMLSDHIEGILDEQRYSEELRRKSMLEIRRYLESREG